MAEWFDDPEVNDLLTKLMDRLCTLERMAGEARDSMLVLIPADKRYPVLFAQGGKPWFLESLTNHDVEFGIKAALKRRLSKIEALPE